MLEERLNYTFQKNYNVGQYDERIIPSKCKLNPCRVYKPKKPCKFGMPVWNLCDSTTGYNFAFQSYDTLLFKAMIRRHTLNCLFMQLLTW